MILETAGLAVPGSHQSCHKVIKWLPDWSLGWEQRVAWDRLEGQQPRIEGRGLPAARDWSLTLQCIVRSYITQTWEPRDCGAGELIRAWLDTPTQPRHGDKSVVSKHQMSSAQDNGTRYRTVSQARCDWGWELRAVTEWPPLWDTHISSQLFHTVKILALHHTIVLMITFYGTLMKKYTVTHNIQTSFR